MSANLTMTSELEYPVAKAGEKAGVGTDLGHRSTRWALVGAQVLVLFAYAMALAFLIKTTVGTLVLFSLVAPVFIAIAVLTLAGVAIYEFRRRHGVHAFEVYDRGETIIRQGEHGDCAYFIQSGEVEMVCHENGSERVLARLTQGDYFGEKALMCPAPRIATIRALTQTRVGIIRKRSLFAMVIVLPASLDRHKRHGRAARRSREFEL